MLIRIDHHVPHEVSRLKMYEDVLHFEHFEHNRMQINTANLTAYHRTAQQARLAGASEHRISGALDKVAV